MKDREKRKEQLVFRLEALLGSTTQKLRSELLELSESELINLINKHHTPYTLKLHERYYDNKINKDILRVPSGWIYYEYNSATDVLYDGVFIPYSKEQ